MKLFGLACGLMLSLFATDLTKAQPLVRAPDVSATSEPDATTEKDEEARKLLDQILDLGEPFGGSIPYLPESSGWGGALLPDPTYRVPEHERIYPPGYLERKRRKENPGAVQ